VERQRTTRGTGGGTNIVQSDCFCSPASESRCVRSNPTLAQARCERMLRSIRGSSQCRGWSGPTTSASTCLWLRVGMVPWPRGRSGGIPYRVDDRRHAGGMEGETGHALRRTAGGERGLRTTATSSRSATTIERSEVSRSRHARGTSRTLARDGVRRVRCRVVCRSSTIVVATNRRRRKNWRRQRWRWCGRERRGLMINLMRWV
jgi:hypothetical protein